MAALDGLVGDDAQDRGRPQAPRSPHRHHVGVAHLGFGNDSPSAPAHDRAGRRALHGWRPLDLMQAKLPPACARPIEAVSPFDAGEASGGTRSGSTAIPLTDAKTFAAFLAPLSKKRWFVYAKRPFAGPEQVLAYLSRYTHRVAISNSRLIAVDQRSVTFKVKDYRIEGPGRHTTMTLDAGEFIRRFLIHVLPKGFHRIRHYGLFASANRAETIAQARQLLGLAAPAAEEAVEIDPAAAQVLAQPCPCCGGRMFVIETFEAGCQPRYHPTAPLLSSQSGSTPHEHITHPHRQTRFSLVTTRPRRRSTG